MLFLGCVHYIKIFLFISFFNSCALNKFSAVFCKSFYFDSRRIRREFLFIPIFYTYYFGKRNDMIHCTTFKNICLKMPAIWDTLMDINEENIKKYKIKDIIITY